MNDILCKEFERRRCNGDISVAPPDYDNTTVLVDLVKLYSSTQSNQLLEFLMERNQYVLRHALPCFLNG